MIKINKGKIISYLIFVAIATLFWISTVLNKKSSYTKDIWVEVIAPDSLIVLNGSLYKANLTLEGKGVDLIFESRHNKNNPLKIILSPNSKLLTSDDITEKLSNETSRLNIDIVNIKFPSKALSIDLKVTKKVPVKINCKVNFEKLHGLKSDITSTPDSILITGPKTYLNKITNWNTINKSYPNSSKSIVENIKLKSPMRDKISLSRSEVKINIPVEEYTEKKMMLPVNIQGAEKENIEILPSLVEVSFLIGLSKFDSVTTDDFSANVYIEQDSIKSVSYPVSIVKKPKLVSIQYIRPNYVDAYLKNSQE